MAHKAVTTTRSVLLKVSMAAKSTIRDSNGRPSKEHTMPVREIVVKPVIPDEAKAAITEAITMITHSKGSSTRPYSCAMKRVAIV